MGNWLTFSVSNKICKASDGRCSPKRHSPKDINFIVLEHIRQIILDAEPCKHNRSNFAEFNEITSPVTMGVLYPEAHCKISLV
mgnify:CR=1 FL=1